MRRGARRGSRAGLPGGMERKAEEDEPAHAASGACAWAVEVMRPPNDLPPANEREVGRDGARLGDGGAARRPPAPPADRAGGRACHVRKLIAQRGNPSAASASASACMNGCRIPAPGAVRQHEERPRIRAGEAGIRQRSADWSQLDVGVADRVPRVTAISSTRACRPALRPVRHGFSTSRSGSRFELRHPRSARADRVTSGCRASWLTSRHASGVDTGAPGSGRTLNGATMSWPSIRSGGSPRTPCRPGATPGG